MAQTPHTRTFDEIARRPEGTGRDAVLVRESDRSFGLYVVQNGRSLHGVPRLAVFVHANDLTCTWSAAGIVRVSGSFGDVVLLQGATEHSRGRNLIEIAVTPGIGLSFLQRLRLLVKRGS